MKRLLTSYFFPLLICVSLFACNKKSSTSDFVLTKEIIALKLLLKSGMDINKADEDGDTLLFQAATEGDLEVIKFLLSKGADVNLRNKEGATVIDSLALFSHKSDKIIVKLFVEHGANINSKNDDGNTALHSAVLITYPDLVEALLKNGADPEIRNNTGSTPIWNVCVNVNVKKAIKIVDLLLAYDADINTRDSEGESLSSYVYCQRGKELMNHMFSKGLK